MRQKSNDSGACQASGQAQTLRASKRPGSPGRQCSVKRTEESLQSSSINILEDLILDTIRAGSCAEFGVINSREKLSHGKRLLYTVKIHLAEERTGFRRKSSGTDERGGSLVMHREESLGLLL